MLLYSLELGDYSKNYKQFDTIPKMHSSFSNAWGVLARGMCVLARGMRFNISTGREDQKKDRLTQ
jgi:hypothetical protein